MLSPHPTGPVHIVVIDDNPADVGLLREFFDQEGEPYRLEVLTDGEQALRFVREFAGQPEKPRPSLVLTELNLPKNDGLEVLQAMQATAAFSRVAVGVLTDGVAPRERAALARLHPRFIRIKPLDLEGFEKVAQEIWQCARQQRAIQAAAESQAVPAADIGDMLSAAVRAAIECNRLAADQFQAVVHDIPSDLPAPDGMFRIQQAGAERRRALRALERATERLNDFLVRNIVPEDLK